MAGRRPLNPRFIRHGLRGGLGLAMILVGCHRPLDSARTVIDVPGTYECFDRQTVITVSEAPHDRLNYSVRRGRAEFGPAEPSLHKAASWLIYPETPGAVWVYDGDKDLTRVVCNDDGGAKFTSSQVVPSLLAEAPARLVQRLPARNESKVSGFFTGIGSAIPKGASVIGPGISSRPQNPDTTGWPAGKALKPPARKASVSKPASPLKVIGASWKAARSSASRPMESVVIARTGVLMLTAALKVVETLLLAARSIWTVSVPAPVSMVTAPYESRIVDVHGIGPIAGGDDCGQGERESRCRPLDPCHPVRRSSAFQYCCSSPRQYSSCCRPDHR